MKDFSDLTFEYSGSKYTFIATLFVLINGQEYSLPLLNDNIQLFEYLNLMNELVMTGTLTYIDEYAHVDKFINQQYTYVRILMVKHEQQRDGDVMIEKLSKEDKLNHTFIVSGFNIIERHRKQITYKLDLISRNWFNCVANINLSTYGVDKKPPMIFSTIKNALTKCGLRVKDSKYDNVTTNVRAHYISRDNDNAMTVVDYMLNKLYFYSTKDDSFKSLIYNETDDVYQLFDIKNTQTSTGSYVTVLSFFLSTLETLLNEDPVDLRMISKFKTTDGILTTFNINMYAYDYDKNKFISVNTNEDRNISFMNKTFDKSGYFPKYKKMFTSLNKYYKSGSYWNTDIQMYADMQKTLFEDNALVISVVGEILRKPGSYMNISVDRDPDVIVDEEIQKLINAKNKYKAFEGSWMISKTRHLISPCKKFYRQNLVLIRNYFPFNPENELKTSNT